MSGELSAFSFQPSAFSRQLSVISQNFRLPGEGRGPWLKRAVDEWTPAFAGEAYSEEG